MDIDQVGINLIKKFEGCVLRVYKDAIGLDTIGIGHLIKKGESFTVLTQKEAEDLLHKDLQIFIDGLNKLIKVTLTQNQFNAIVSLSFNIGLGNIKKSTLLKKVNLNDMSGAAEQFKVWNKAGGKTLPGLIRRRTAEYNLFRGIS